MASATSVRGSSASARAAWSVVSVAPSVRSSASATTVAHASSIGMPSYGPVDIAPVISRARSAVQPTIEVVPDPGDPASVAMLSGSFDPPTIGHEVLALEGARASGLVILVYSVRTLAKEGTGPPSLLSEESRL